MKLHIYAYRDKKLGAYLTPMTISDEPEKAKVGIGRSLIKADSATKAKFKDLDFYYLGSFNDETGLITAVAPDLLVSLDQYCLEEGDK